VAQETLAEKLCVIAPWGRCNWMDEACI